MKTKSEKLKIGQLTLCNGCGKKKPFDHSWMMDKTRKIYCPSCVKTKGKVMVSI